jgi:TPR repeat protein
VAALKLGFLIEDDASLSTDFGAAGRWFIRACEIGDDAGCHNAGVGFEYGKNGLTKSYDQARDYYQRRHHAGICNRNITLEACIPICIFKTT